MNKNQGIVIVSAGIGLNLIKAARPAWQESGESARFLGVLDTSNLMFLLGAVAAICAVLMLVFQTKRQKKQTPPHSH